MKVFIIICLSIVTLSSAQTNSSENYNVKPEDIKESMDYLASDELRGRATGTEGIAKAAAFIEAYLKANEISPYFETYKDHFNITLKQSDGDTLSINGFNVVGYIEGTDPQLKDEFVVLGGHYDHIGVRKNSIAGDSIANGANDDASGTIAAMEFGKFFSKTKSNKRSVLITLFAAEEMGLKGSAHLAERLKSKGINLHSMINFEMIGVPRDSTKTMAYISGFKKSNMAQVLNEGNNEEIIGFFEKAAQFNLFMRSDNYPFFKAFNVPAHAISTFDFTNFEYYHHVDDEADQMDYNHMAAFINKMLPALERLVNAEPGKIKLTNE